jgi:secreted trypsin-like serine protease
MTMTLGKFRYLVPLFAVVIGIRCSDPQTGKPAPAGGAPPAGSTAGAPTPVVAPAAAQVDEVAKQHRPTASIEFEAAFDLNQTPAAGAPQLRHGIEATTAEWPASLYATFATPEGTAACTAALVGPEVMLTAAHCVPTMGGVTFKYKGQLKPYVAMCTQHDQYVSNADPSADYALCKLDRPFAEFQSFQYETIDTSAMASRLNATVVLTGFGCVSDIVGNGPPDGKYRIGTNVVAETSATPANQRSRGAGLYSGRQDNNLFTKDDPQLANLCPGDSGGPAFVTTGSGFARRVLVGVNSRVFYRDQTRTTYGASLVSSTGTSEFINWAKNWANPKSYTTPPPPPLAICGIEGSPQKCRT